MKNQIFRNSPNHVCTFAIRAFNSYWYNRPTDTFSLLLLTLDLKATLKYSTKSCQIKIFLDLTGCPIQHCSINQMLMIDWLCLTSCVKNLSFICNSIIKQIGSLSFFPKMELISLLFCDFENSYSPIYWKYRPIQIDLKSCLSMSLTTLNILLQKNFISRFHLT